MPEYRGDKFRPFSVTAELCRIGIGIKQHRAVAGDEGYAVGGGVQNLCRIIRLRVGGNGYIVGLLAEIVLYTLTVIVIQQSGYNKRRKQHGQAA